MLNVEKIIRVLGYTMYTILWSPFIVFTLIAAPIVLLVFAVKNGFGVKDVMRWYRDKLKEGFEHDRDFINTGVWKW